MDENCEKYVNEKLPRAERFDFGQRNAWSKKTINKLSQFTIYTFCREKLSQRQIVWYFLNMFSFIVLMIAYGRAL